MNWENENLREHEVRLFPLIRISSNEEAEQRATSSLLAMVKSISEFGRAFVRAAGGPAGKLTCYTEVTFDAKGPGGQKRPDGVVHVVRGKTDWKALLEVKVGNNRLNEDQCDDYHKVAKENGFDAMITISNQPAQPNGQPPVALDGRRLRSVPAFHFSWERLLSEAQMLSRRKTIEDPDQKWMLDEWIRYVGDENSKIIEKPHLGEHWHDVLQSARAGNLRVASQKLEDVLEHWDGFVRIATLRLSAKLGVPVRQKIPRADRKDPAGRIKRRREAALKTGQLDASLRIPDAVGDLSVAVVLQAKAVRFGVELDSKDEGRQSTRVDWIVRQLRSLEKPPRPLNLIVEWDQRGLLSTAKLSDLLQDSAPLMRDALGMPISKTVMPKKFRVEWTATLHKKGSGRSSTRVLEGIFTDLERFYRGAVEQLMAYVPRAPRLPAQLAETASTKGDAPSDTDISQATPATPQIGTPGDRSEERDSTDP